MQIDIPSLREGSIWLSIVSQLFSNKMNKLLEPHDLTLVQFSVFNHLFRQEIGERQNGHIVNGSRISDIAAAVEAMQPAVTKIVTKFEQRGWVTILTSDKDKRTRRVIISKSGAEKLIEIQKSIGPQLGAVFMALEPDELKTFIGSLKKIGQFLDENRT